MELAVTVSGKVASGKTRTLQRIKEALQRQGAPVEEIKASFYEVCNNGPREQVDAFTVPVTHPEPLPFPIRRETLSIDYNGAGRPALFMGVRWLGTFHHGALARQVMALLAATPEQRAAIDAILADSDFGRPARPEVQQNCRGGGGDFAEGAGVISAEMAPALHGCKDMAEVLAQDDRKRYLDGALSRMIDRWEEQRLTISGMSDLLGTVADVFEGYAADHARKAEIAIDESQEQAAHDKAERNRRLARMCRAAIPLAETGVNG